MRHVVSRITVCGAVAHALAENATQVSYNTREFERVPGLRLEKWA